MCAFNPPLYGGSWVSKGLGISPEDVVANPLGNPLCLHVARRQVNLAWWLRAGKFAEPGGMGGPQNALGPQAGNLAWWQRAGKFAEPGGHSYF